MTLLDVSVTTALDVAAIEDSILAVVDDDAAVGASVTVVVADAVLLMVVATVDDGDTVGLTVATVVTTVDAVCVVDVFGDEADVVGMVGVVDDVVSVVDVVGVVDDVGDVVVVVDVVGTVDVVVVTVVEVVGVAVLDVETTAARMKLRHSANLHRWGPVSVPSRTPRHLNVPPPFQKKMPAHPPVSLHSALHSSRLIGPLNTYDRSALIVAKSYWSPSVASAYTGCSVGALVVVETVLSLGITVVWSTRVVVGADEVSTSAVAVATDVFSVASVMVDGTVDDVDAVDETVATVAGREVAADVEPTVASVEVTTPAQKVHPLRLHTPGPDRSLLHMTMRPASRRHGPSLS